MAKYFLVTITFILFGVLLMPLTASAAYNTVNFTEDTNVVLGNGTTLVISSGGNIASMTIYDAYVSFEMENLSSVTVTSNDRKVLTNNVGVSTVCTESFSQVALTSTQTETITVTPGDTCGGGGGGGGAVISAPPTGEQEEEEEEEEEVVVPTETVTGEATVSASEGGTVEATTEQGGTASLEMPADAVTADADVTITPSETTAEAVSTEIEAVPTGQNIVGGYVYSFAVESEGVAVTIFEESVTVTLSYTDDQVSDLDEDSLVIYYYDESLSQWLALDSTVDAENNTVTATTAHFTLFALMGEEEEVGEEEEEEEEEEVIPISEMTIDELKAEIARIAALIAELQDQLAALVGQLTANLQYGDRGDDVELLQTWLAKDSEIYPEAIVSGWFGPLTKAAVIRFQEEYTEDVLAPWNLTSGTGYVGSTTRDKLNELYSGQ